MFRKSWIQSSCQNVRRWWANVLQYWLYRMHRADNDAQHEVRLENVRQFVYLELPLLLGIPNFSVVEGGRYNYFTLPSGDWPHYDFVVPQLSLYVCVPGVQSGDWPEARARGVSRSWWEASQLDLQALQELTSTVEYGGDVQTIPRLLILPWNVPINKLFLAQAFKMVMGVK